MRVKQGRNKKKSNTIIELVTYLDNWDIADEEELAGLYGYTLEELLTAWASWNAQQCEALGIRTEQP